MSGYNPHISPLNTFYSMLNLGNQPKIPGQCKQNLRFINQQSSNSSNRYTLRRAFGNQLFNTIDVFNSSHIVFKTESDFTVRSFSNKNHQQLAKNGTLNKYGVSVKQINQISQFNRSSTEFIFTVPKTFDLCANNLALDLPHNSTESSFSDGIKEVFNPYLDTFDFSSSLVPTDATEVLIYNKNTSNIILSKKLNINFTTDISDFTFIITDDTGEFNSGLTPFRKAFNAGDMLNTNNSATSSLLPKPPNQVTSLRNMFGWQNNAGSVKQDKNGSFYSGNQRFIYDGSDYARFKKLQAINRNYNDITFGGDQHSGSQQAYRRVVNR